MAVEGRIEAASTNHVDLIYKVDYLVQNSLLSSLVSIQYKVYSFDQL